MNLNTKLLELTYSSKTTVSTDFTGLATGSKINSLPSLYKPIKILMLDKTNTMRL